MTLRNGVQCLKMLEKDILDLTCEHSLDGDDAGADNWYDLEEEEDVPRREDDREEEQGVPDGVRQPVSDPVVLPPCI